jgi:exopolysaccharide biosynthesis predicted pyruvyltransferase EpsI
MSNNDNKVITSWTFDTGVEDPGSGIIRFNTPNVAIDIRRFLSNYQGRHITYVPNVGNAGDHLIAYATLQIFDELGLDYSIGGHTHKFVDKLLFYGGGGNFIGTYSNCRDFLTKNKDDNEIVILPHTVKDEDLLMPRLGENITILCRERKSYEYVHRLRETGTTLLTHDMAFHASVQNTPRSKGVLNAFRTDMESTDIILPPDNIDISIVLSKWDWTKETINEVGANFLNTIGEFETINTNRLHVAIAGMLCGCQVNFYRNSYWKNKEVYDFSMTNESSVTWME